MLEASTARVIGVAIPIPDPWGAQLQRHRERYGDPLAHAIPTHVTVLPPTTVDHGVLPEVERHLSRAAEESQSFSMRLRGTGTFRPVSPVVYVALAQGISGCESVEQRVRSGILERTLHFPYHPHVTVAHDVAEEQLDLAFDELGGFDARLDVWGFTLYEHVEGVWRPQRDFVFGPEPLGPLPQARE